MSLRLSEIETRLASHTSAALSPATRACDSAVLKSRLREPLGAIGQGKGESQGVESVSSGPLALMEPMSGVETQLLQEYENRRSQAVEPSIPELEGWAGQDPILTNSVRRLLRTLWAIVVSRSLQIRFPLLRTILSVFVDPTEQKRKAVLRLVSDGSAAQTLAFWDSLEPDLEGWVKTLNENDRHIFITKLGLRFHWR